MERKGGSDRQVAWCVSVREWEMDGPTIYSVDRENDLADESDMHIYICCD
jgi:hypothetical protein